MQLPDFLRPEGELYLVTVSENDPKGLSCLRASVHASVGLGLGFTAFIGQPGSMVQCMIMYDSFLQPLPDSHSAHACMLQPLTVARGTPRAGLIREMEARGFKGEGE